MLYPRIQSLALSAVFLILQSIAQASWTVIDEGHIDFVKIIYGPGGFSFYAEYEELQQLPLDSTITVIGESDSIARPSGEQWDFLGTPAGSPVWIFPQSNFGSEHIPYVGLNSEGVPSGVFGNWNPGDPRITDSLPWIQFSLVGVRGPSETANFSMWRGGGEVWMSTALHLDGGSHYYLLPGSHDHMNWGFTETGHYALTFTVTAFDNTHGLVTSDPFTLNFGVGVVPEATHFAILLALAALLFSVVKKSRTPIK